MKITACLFLLFLFLQPLAAQRPVFLRVYNLQGKKTGRGFIYKTTDSSIILSRRPAGDMYKEIPATGIGIIKSKHSIAGRIGITSLKVIGYASIVGIVIVAAAIAANNPEHFSQQGNNADTDAKRAPPDHYGVPRKQYTVNGNRDNWKKVKEELSPLR